MRTMQLSMGHKPELSKGGEARRSLARCRGMIKDSRASAQEVLAATGCRFGPNPRRIERVSFARARDN